MNAVVATRSMDATLRIYLLEARSEFLRYWRTPGASIPTLIFPMMFYLFFGVLLARGHEGTERSLYALAGLGSFGVISPGLFSFGVGFAFDRGMGWLQVKRASPMPPTAYLIAKVALTMFFALLVTLILCTMAAILAHVHLAASQWLGLGVTLVLGSIPFCAMGLAIGAWVKPQAAPAVVNLTYLPMSFLSGLWIPLQLLPTFMQKLGAFLPAYHLGVLAYGQVGVQDVAILPHVLVLAAFTLAFMAVAAQGYRHNPPSNAG